MSESPDPVETWVPFTVEDAGVFAGKFVRYKSGLSGECFLPTIFGPKGISLAWCEEIVPWEMLLERYQFLDGTPCGKQVTQ